MSYRKITALIERKKKLLVGLSFSIITLILSSCGMWRDFNTYFNTYWNAKTIFDNAEEQILKQKKNIFAFREDQNSNNQLGMQSNFPQSQFPNQQFGQQQFPNQQFQNPQFQNPQFPNQANSSQPLAGVQPLIPAGTLSYMQLFQEFTRVIEKCSKILQYESTSSYFDDALFMTGKSFYYQHEYSRAQRKFIELAALTDSKYAPENKLWLAKTHLQLHNFEEGLKLIEEVKQTALKDDDEQLFNQASISKISFFEFREEYENAITECKSYLGVSKDDEINALVAFELGKIYLHLKNKAEALNSFQLVLTYSPTFDVEFLCRLEYAKLLKDLDRMEESESAFSDLRYSGKFINYLDQVLLELGQIYYEKNETKKAIDIFREVDSTYKMIPSSGIAAFKLAEVYKNGVRDYDSALVYYNKTASTMAPYDLKMKAVKKSQDLNKYFTNKIEIKEIETQILYVQNPARFIQDSVDYDIAYRQYTEENKRLMEAQNMGQQNMMPNQEALLQQQRMAQQQIPKNKKDITPSMLIAQGKYKKPIRPIIKEDSLNTNIAKSYFSLGSIFFSELEVPDSAKYYFQKILREYGSKSVAAQTMYSLGIYYETEQDTIRADSLFKFIYDNFEKDPMKKAAGEKLGLIKKDEKKSSIEKEEDPAEKFYIDAEKKYFDKKYSEAIDSFKVIVKNFPKSLSAQKSLYYIGFIYERELKNYDSAAASYALLIKDYVGTNYSNAVSAKYNEYKIEKERIKREEDEKLKAKEEKLKTQDPRGDKAIKENPKPAENVNTVVPVSKDTTKLKDDPSSEGLIRQQLLEKAKSVPDTSKKKIEK